MAASLARAGACAPTSAGECALSVCAEWLHSADEAPQRAQVALNALETLAQVDTGLARQTLRLALQGTAMPATDVATLTGRAAHALLLTRLLEGTAAARSECAACAKTVLREALEGGNVSDLLRALRPALRADLAMPRALHSVAQESSCPPGVRARVAGELVRALTDDEGLMEGALDNLEAALEGKCEASALAAADALVELLKDGVALSNSSKRRLEKAGRKMFEKRLAQWSVHCAVPEGPVVRMAATIGDERAKSVFVDKSESIGAILFAEDELGGASHASAGSNSRRHLFAQRASALAMSMGAAAEGYAATHHEGGLPADAVLLANCAAVAASTGRLAARAPHEEACQANERVLFAPHLALALMEAAPASGLSVRVRHEALRSAGVALGSASMRAATLTGRLQSKDGGSGDRSGTHVANQLAGFARAAGAVYRSASAATDKDVPDSDGHPASASLAQALAEAYQTLRSGGEPTPVKAPKSVDPPPSTRELQSSGDAVRSRRERKAAKPWWIATAEATDEDASSDEGDESDESDDATSDEDGSEFAPWQHQRLMSARLLMSMLGTGYPDSTLESADAREILREALSTSAGAPAACDSASAAAVVVAKQLAKDLDESIPPALLLAHCALLERCMWQAIAAGAPLGGCSAIVEGVLREYELPHAPSVRQMLRAILAGASRSRALVIAIDGLVPCGNGRRRGRVADAIKAATRTLSATAGYKRRRTVGATEEPFHPLFLAANAEVEAAVEDELASFLPDVLCANAFEQMLQASAYGSMTPKRVSDFCIALDDEAPLLSGIVCGMRWRLSRRFASSSTRRRLPRNLTEALAACLGACTVFARVSFVAAAAGAPPSASAASVLSDCEALTATVDDIAAVAKELNDFFAARDALMQQYAASLGGVATPKDRYKKTLSPKSKAQAAVDADGEATEKVGTDGDDDYEAAEAMAGLSRHPSGPQRKLKGKGKEEQGSGTFNAFVEAALASDPKEKGDRHDDYSDLKVRSSALLDAC